MKVVFRTDASVTIGTGHVVRCLTLAKQLAMSGAECHFVMRRLDGNMIAIVEESGFPVITLEHTNCAAARFGDLAHSAWLGVDWPEDAKDTRSAIATLADIDWLVVDHYGIDVRWEEELRGSSAHIMVIDDLADRTHDCDILLDQNLQANEGRYAGLLPTNCIRLIGPHYALLNPDFARLRAKTSLRSRKAVAQIFIYLGGIDLPGFTLIALQAVEKVWQERVGVDVVVGKSNPHYKSIANWCSIHEGVRLHHGSDAMAELMSNCDIAIGAAGATSWERCCLSLPSIVVALADNQMPGGRAMGEQGAAIYLGAAPTIVEEDLIAALRLVGRNDELRTHISTAAGALVDGKGAGRVASYLRGSQIKLRLAGLDDCEQVWQWRNAEETRRYAHDSASITLAEHKKWYGAVLDSGDQDLLIGEIGGEPVGVLRFDYEGIESTISIYLVPGRSGRGEGTQLLRAGSGWLASNRPNVTTINAEIRFENTASRLAFDAAGYKQFTETLRCALQML